MRPWKDIAAGAALLSVSATGAMAQEKTAVDAAQTKAPSSWGALYPTLTFASEYRYDGKSNSSGEPVVQASLYLRRPDRTFIGAFASTVDFNGYHDPSTSVEINIYAGRNWDVGGDDWYVDAHTRFSVQATYTMFPDNETPGPTYDFLQLTVRARHRPDDRWMLEGSLSFTPRASYGGGRAWKWEAGADYRISSWLFVGGAAGLREVQRRSDYSFWNVGATATVGQAEFDLRYYDTDLTFITCGHSANCGSGLVAKVSWNAW